MSATPRCCLCGRTVAKGATLIKLRRDGLSRWECLSKKACDAAREQQKVRGDG